MKMGGTSQVEEIPCGGGSTRCDDSSLYGTDRPSPGGSSTSSRPMVARPVGYTGHGRGAADGNTNVKLFLYSYVYGLGFRV